MMTALPIIPMAVGANRIIRGVRVEHVCGDPSLSETMDRALTHRIVETALGALQTAVDGPTLFEPAEPSEAREAVHAS